MFSFLSYPLVKYDQECDLDGIASWLDTITAVIPAHAKRDNNLFGGPEKIPYKFPIIVIDKFAIQISNSFSKNISIKNCGNIFYKVITKNPKYNTVIYFDLYRYQELLQTLNYQCLHQYLGQKHTYVDLCILIKFLKNFDKYTMFA